MAEKDLDKNQDFVPVCTVIYYYSRYGYDGVTQGPIYISSTTSDPFHHSNHNHHQNNDLSDQPVTEDNYQVDR